MTNELSIGKKYRFTLRSTQSLGALEGIVRSLSLPAGMFGNRDGEHRIWVAGEQFEWFLRPAEIADFEEVDELQTVEFVAALPPRSMGPEQPYRGRCLRRGRRAERQTRPESHPLLQRLGDGHRRD
jgi:hypothetical protein